MTAQEQIGRRREGVYSAPPRSETRRQEPRAESRPQREEQPVVYVYGDRVCRKESKQRQLYKQYGTAAGYTAGRRTFRPGAAPPKKRYKLVLENIINLFDSIDERRKQDEEAAKRNAIMRKKLLEHRRGFFLALFMIAFLVGFVLLVYNLFFGIRTIYAENTVHYTGEEIIAASGVAEGDKLYSFRADEAEARITFVCPYIQSVDVTRTVPNKVSFAVTSDQEAYWVNVYGEKLVLSVGLRVLGSYDPKVHGGLTELRLPEISGSVAGRTITFSDGRNERFVREILGYVGQSGLAGRIGMVDLREAYNVVMYCDDIYLLKFGGEKDFASKLRMAEKTISDPDFDSGTPAEIDLSVTGEASARYDHTLHFSEQTSDGSAE